MEENNDSRKDLGTSGLYVEEEGDRNHPYFFTNVVFLVEGRLFRMPRILFEGQSTVFKDMFMLPSPPVDESNEEGGSESNPIRLDGVKKAEFESFLWVLVPLDPLRRRMTKNDWLSALKLATMWDFNGVRNIAINGLDLLPLNEVERVVILNDFDIKEWKVAAYTKLVARAQSLSADDVDALGSQLTAQYCAVRDIFLRDGNHRYDSQRSQAARTALHKIFGDEIPLR